MSFNELPPRPPQQNFYSDQTSFGPSYPPVPPPMQPPSRKPGLWQRYKAARRRTKLGVGCGVLFLALMLCMCSAAGVGAAFPQPKTTTSAQTDNQQTSLISTTQPTHVALIATATMKPTAPPTPTAVPTQVPTPTPVPTLAPTPTPIPTKAPPPPTQPPAPTQPPSGTNGNPWGYDFTAGNLIYSPVAAFCGQYFSCVSTFWVDTRGYVVECGNGEYSHSGGIRGACSRDGGVAAVLYSH